MTFWRHILTLIALPPNRSTSTDHPSELIETYRALLQFERGFSEGSFAHFSQAIELVRTGLGIFLDPRSDFDRGAVLF